MTVRYLLSDHCPMPSLIWSHSRAHQTVHVIEQLFRLVGQLYPPNGASLLFSFNTESSTAFHLEVIATSLERLHPAFVYSFGKHELFRENNQSQKSTQIIVTSFYKRSRREKNENAKRRGNRRYEVCTVLLTQLSHFQNLTTQQSQNIVKHIHSVVQVKLF